MNILFLSCPSVRDDTQKTAVFLQPLSGANLLAQLLRDAGHEVHLVLDAHRVLVDKDRLADFECRASRADLICLSATSFNWHTLMRCAEHIRGRLRTCPPIVVGGVHATLVPRHLVGTGVVDIAVAGEGEKAIFDIVRALEGRQSLRNVQGVHYRDGSVVVATLPRALMSSAELGQIPNLRWDECEANPPYLTVQTSRGCKMQCTFCAIPFHCSWRHFPTEHILKSISLCIEKMSGNANPHVLFGDDCFTAEPAIATGILDAVSREFPQVAITIEARIEDLVNDALFAAVSRANCRCIQVGVECGYDSGLRAIRKGLTTQVILGFAARAEKAGFNSIVRYSYMVGFPWESVRQCCDTIDFAYGIAVRYPCVVQVNWWHTVPGNSLFDEVSARYCYNESICDIDNWFADKRVFFRTHPWLNEDSVEYVTEYANLLAMLRPHIPIVGSAFGRPWTDTQSPPTPIGLLHAQFGSELKALHTLGSN